MVTNKVALSAIGCPTEDVVGESPVKWCSVSLSDVINRGKRLEASVFDVEAKQARNTIVNGKYGYTFLGSKDGMIEQAYYPGRFKRIYCESGYGEAFFLPSQITDIKPKAEKYISALTKCDIDSLRIKLNHLLLTRSGTIGAVSCVSQTIANNIFSDDVIRISFKNEYDLGYVYTFFKSKIGNKILLTNSYGAVITHIEPEHLASVPIPEAPPILKQEIHQLIVRSYDLRDESNRLLDEAENLLKAELHLPVLSEFDVKLYDQTADVDTFNVKLHDINGRLDASYHVPIVDAIVAHLEKYAAEVTTVGDERISKKVVLAGIFKRTYVEKEFGYPFLGGKEITQLAPQTEKFLSKAIHKQRYEKELKVKENTILITDRGTIGIVAFVPKHWDGYAISQNVLKLIPANNDIAGYTYIFLSSEIGKQLICHHTYGAVVDMIDNNEMSNVKIPLLKNKEIQEKINTLALQANEKRYEAYQLEQKALKLMDEKVIFAKKD